MAGVSSGVSGLNAEVMVLNCVVFLCEFVRAYLQRGQALDTNKKIKDTL